MRSTGGGEVKTEGDSFYVVFPTAGTALACATAILQHAARATRENPSRPLRVGIGIHAGEPVPHEGQYVGSAVNLAARLASQAGAGEILVSETVRSLLRTAGAAPMTPREGVVLKGVGDPPRVYAVSWQDAVAPARAPVAAAHEVAIAAEPPTSRRILSPEVIGREAELAQLDALFADAKRGVARTALVSGDAGLGKSAFLRLFGERARASGARAFVGECTEIEARRPFGPFVDILRVAFRDLSASGGEGVMSGGTADLLRMVPELKTGDASTEAQSDADRYRVHAAFSKAFADLARTGPLVVVIEDLHWADEASLELFPYLARKLRDERVLLLATYRSDELHRRHPINHVLAELARGRLADDIRLPKLTRDETAALIRAAFRLKEGPTPAFRDAVHERCEGNPFFVEEVLKALVERGDLWYADGQWHRKDDVADLAIPVSVRDAVQQRMQRLSPDARRAVQVAAVIGQRFDFALLQHVSKLDETALLEALRAAIDAQLVEEVPDHGVEELYGFRHALTREAVLGELLQRERRILHRAVAEAIEARPDAGVRAEELAYHFDEARDAKRAFQYHELAARDASRVFAFSRALRHLERAVELADDDEPALADMQLRLAEAAFLLPDVPRAIRAAQEARKAFAARGDARRAGEALDRLANYSWATDPREAQCHADEALRLLEPLGESPELAGAYATLARLAMLDDRATRR